MWDTREQVSQGGAGLAPGAELVWIHPAGDGWGTFRLSLCECFIISVTREGSSGRMKDHSIPSPWPLAPLDRVMGGKAGELLPEETFLGGDSRLHGPSPAFGGPASCPWPHL